MSGGHGCFCLFRAVALGPRWVQCGQLSSYPCFASSWRIEVKPPPNEWRWSSALSGCPVSACLWRQGPMWDLLAWDLIRFLLGFWRLRARVAPGAASCSGFLFCLGSLAWAPNRRPVSTEGYVGMGGGCCDTLSAPAYLTGHWSDLCMQYSCPWIAPQFICSAAIHCDMLAKKNMSATFIIVCM